MSTTKKHTFTHRLALLAVLGTITPATQAEEGDEIDLLTNPNTRWVSFGVLNIGEDNQRFGVYNGLDEAQAYGVAGLNFVRREDATWLRVSARNLGLSTQELHGEYEKQGQWRVAIDYTQIPRTTPYDIHTGWTGIGTDTLSRAAYAGNNLQAQSTAPAIKLGTERDRTSIEASRYFGPEFDLRVNYQHEKKEGTRLFGRGNSSTHEFLAEPIDSTIQQLDAVLSYTGDRLQLSGGYYGAFYDNSNPALTITGGGSNMNTAPATTPIALPPDNLSHQLHLTGAYKFTDTTRGKFKLAYTHATQTDDFIGVGNDCTFPIAGSPCNISGRTDLGGELNTTLLQLGLTSRPMPKLNLRADLRYEDRDDQTAIARYIVPNASTDGFNEPRSLRNESGKFEAAYQLPQGFHVTGSMDVERKTRTMDGVRVVGYRETTEETTQRVELRRVLADALSGSLSYAESSRSGSDYRTLRVWNTNGTANNFNDDFFGANYVLGGLLQPIFIADRDRNKIRLALDWAPTDALSLQFNAEDSRDVYGAARQTAQIGARSGHAWLAGIDATLAINDNWKLTAWGTRESTGITQAACTANATCAAGTTLWNSALDNRVDSLGIGVRGKVRGKLELGGDLVVADDQSIYDLTADAAANATTITNVGLFNAQGSSIETELISLKLFGIYPVAKESSVRVDYALDQRKTDDWIWTGWQYTDGTVVDQHADELVHFLGVTFRYGF